MGIFFTRRSENGYTVFRVRSVKWILLIGITLVVLSGLKHLNALFFVVYVLLGLVACADVSYFIIKYTLSPKRTVKKENKVLEFWLKNKAIS